MEAKVRFEADRGGFENTMEDLKWSHGWYEPKFLEEDEYRLS
jgi:hypothetical protein